MIKKELISEISKDTGFTKKQITVIVDSLLENIEETLINGDNILLTGFGSFSTVITKPKIGRNPKTGEVVEIGSYRKPTFTYSKKLKSKIRDDFAFLDDSEYF